MQVQANINGRALVINYGTNPMGQVAGAWAELPDGRGADLDATEETQMWALAALDALTQRAKTGFVYAAMAGNERTCNFFAGQLKFASDLASGAGNKLAAMDAARSGYEHPAGFEAAWAALPVGAEKLSMAEVQQILAAQGFQVAADAVAGVDVNATEHLKNSKVATVNLDDEHTALAVDGVHSALHADPLVEKTTVSQEGGAA